MQVICEKKECLYCSTSGLCTKDFVFLRPFAGCSEWYNKQGQPYVEQISKALKKEFEKYNKTKETEDNIVE